jgi:hypothetical protein
MILPSRNRISEEIKLAERCADKLIPNRQKVQLRKKINFFIHASFVKESMRQR